MPSPIFPPDVEPGSQARRPSWWRRAVALALRGINRGVLGGVGNDSGAGRDLLPRRFGGGGRGGDIIPG